MTEGDEDVEVVDIMAVVVATVAVGNKVAERETPTECLVSNFTGSETGKCYSH